MDPCLRDRRPDAPTPRRPDAPTPRGPDAPTPQSTPSRARGNRPRRAMPSGDRSGPHAGFPARRLPDSAPAFPTGSPGPPPRGCVPARGCAGGHGRRGARRETRDAARPLALEYEPVSLASRGRRSLAGPPADLTSRILPVRIDSDIGVGVGPRPLRGPTSPHRASYWARSLMCARTPPRPWPDAPPVARTPRGDGDRKPPRGTASPPSSRGRSPREPPSGGGERTRVYDKRPRLSRFFPISAVPTRALHSEAPASKEASSPRGDPWSPSFEARARPFDRPRAPQDEVVCLVKGAVPPQPACSKLHAPAHLTSRGCRARVGARPGLARGVRSRRRNPSGRDQAASRSGGRRRSTQRVASS